jgi:hypothetical protein
MTLSTLFFPPLPTPAFAMVDEQYFFLSFFSPLLFLLLLLLPLLPLLLFKTILPSLFILNLPLPLPPPFPLFLLLSPPKQVLCLAQPPGHLVSLPSRVFRAGYFFEKVMDKIKKISKVFEYDCKSSCIRISFGRNLPFGTFFHLFFSSSLLLSLFFFLSIFHVHDLQHDETKYVESNNIVWSDTWQRIGLFLESLMRKSVFY